MDVAKLPSDQVPKLKTGRFFRVVKKTDRWDNTRPYIQIRKKGRVFGSSLLYEARINLGYPTYRLNEKDILIAMNHAVYSLSNQEKAEEDKASREREEAKLYGDYPPKKIIK